MATQTLERAKRKHVKHTTGRFHSVVPNMFLSRDLMGGGEGGENQVNGVVIENDG